MYGVTVTFFIRISFIRNIHSGHVVGTAFLSLCMDAMYKGQPFGVIENFAVAEKQQGKGIGSQLMKAIRIFAKQCSKLMLLSSSQRADAHRFFEREKGTFDAAKVISTKRD